LTLLLTSDDPVSYSGKIWNIEDMFIQLKSYQQPRLPFATASVGSERSLEFASMYDMHIWSLALEITPPGAIHWSNQWKKVEEFSNKLGTAPSKDDWRVVTYVHLAETTKQAWDEVEKAIERDIHEYFYVIGGHESWLVDQDQDPYSLTAKEIVESRNWIVGTPEDAIKKINEMNDKADGLGGLMFTTHEWTNQNAINNSLELFARYVMPEFKGHSKSIKKAWEITKNDRKNNKIPSLSSKESSPNLDKHKSNLYLNR
jgi:Coenzyme F420-dependent N5,N10-methylene tetrahydromethanopterin reductase and related flavin-dependent oxidoreductases